MRLDSRSKVSRTPTIRPGNTNYERGRAMRTWNESALSAFARWAFQWPGTSSTPDSIWVCTTALPRKWIHSEEGVDPFDSPAELGSKSDALVTMVRGPDALHDVVLGEEGVVQRLRPDRDQILVDTSTVSREATLAVNDNIREAACRFVDGPVLGTVGPAEQGELLILAGTDVDTLSDGRPMLEPFGKVRHVGEFGDGTSMKLTANFLLGVMMEVFSEALAFAEGAGPSPDDVLDVIQNGVLGVPCMTLKSRLSGIGTSTPSSLSTCCSKT